MAFALAKRSGHAGAAAAWFTAHALTALAGTVLVFVHSAAHFDAPPALLLLTLLALMAIGVWARVRGARQMADTFATKHLGFAQPEPRTIEALRHIIDSKRQLLERLDQTANEASFSPTLRHWLTHPLLARQYIALYRRECALMEQRGSVGKAQGWWRPLHLALAGLFLAGLAGHVIVVLFFAGWVAQGRPITWWHLTAW